MHKTTKFISDIDQIPPIAVLFQSHHPPVIDNILKPMKPTGYKDSSADIAVALERLNQKIITPVDNPIEAKDEDWCFADSINGIQEAYDKGARIFWLNTVLYNDHPITKFFDRDIGVIGQHPAMVHKYDDKYLTNQIFKHKDLPIPHELLISNKVINTPDAFLQLEEVTDNVIEDNNFQFPLIIKPLRGRGSQGVVKIESINDLKKHGELLLNDFTLINDEKFLKYGDRLILEEFLIGEEVTISVMPPGKYLIDNEEHTKTDYWSLPIVVRFGHDNGVAPYNGVIAVSQNSRLLEEELHADEKYADIMEACEKAAKIIGALGPIRIDCRFKGDKAYIFDVNLKPNMTGAIRETRKDQNGLTTIAAKGIGWTYKDLIYNILLQAWTIQE